MSQLIDILGSLPKLKDYVSKRASSWDRTGGNRDFIRIEPGETSTLAELDGPASIRHIWFTISHKSSKYLREMVLRIYWDGERNPSVECPVGDFFGLGHGMLSHFISLPLSVVTVRNSISLRGGMNCFFPMPFNKKAKVTVTNESEERCNALYYYIDYQKYEHPLEDIGYFHAWWNMEECQSQKYLLPSKKVNLDGKANYLILDAEGKGHYVGTVVSIFNPESDWFGEGDDMIFIDGEKWPPSLHGTGTEDYFCGAWGYPCGKYDGLFHGITLAGDLMTWSGYWTMYRFHLEAPIAFKKSIRVTIEHGHANDKATVYSSVAYWYQTEPHKPFPSLPPKEVRVRYLKG